MLPAALLQFLFKMDIFAGCSLNLSHVAHGGRVCVVQGEIFDIIAVVTLPAGEISRTNDWEKFVASGRLAAEIELRPPPLGPQSPVAALGRVVIREPVGLPPLRRGAAVSLLELCTNGGNGGGDSGKVSDVDTEVEQPGPTVRLRLSSVIEDAMGLMGPDLRCAVTLTIRPFEHTESVPLSSKMPTPASAAAMDSLVSRADTIGLRGMFASPTAQSLGAPTRTTGSTLNSANRASQTPVAAVVPPGSDGLSSGANGHGRVEGKCSSSECLRARAPFRVVIVNALHIACTPPVLLPSSSFSGECQSHEEKRNTRDGSRFHHSGLRCAVNVMIENRHPSRALRLMSMQVSLDRSTLSIFDEVEEENGGVPEGAGSNGASFSGTERNNDINAARMATQKLSRAVKSAVAAFPVFDTVPSLAKNSSQGTQLDLARAFTSGWVLPAVCTTTEIDESNYPNESSSKDEAGGRTKSACDAMDVRPLPEGLPLRLGPGDRHAFLLVISPARGVVGQGTNEHGSFGHLASCDGSSSDGTLPPPILRQLAVAKAAVQAATCAAGISDQNGSHLGSKTLACFDLGLNFQSPITAMYFLDVSSSAKAADEGCKVDSSTSRRNESEDKSSGEGSNSNWSNSVLKTLSPVERSEEKQAVSSFTWQLPWLGAASSDALLASFSDFGRTTDEFSVELSLLPVTKTSSSALSDSRDAVVQVGVPFVAEACVTNLGNRAHQLTLYCDNTEQSEPQLKQKVSSTAMDKAVDAQNEEDLRCRKNDSQMPPLLSLGDASTARVVAIDATTPLGELLPGQSIAVPLRFLALVPGPATLGPLRLGTAASDEAKCGVAEKRPNCSYRAIDFEVLVQRLV